MNRMHNNDGLFHQRARLESVEMVCNCDTAVH